MHRPTRKNKRTMSGGGKMSKITRRFKDHFKRFFKINENDKIKKCEAWGSLNGIFKFVEAQNTTYANANGKELSGLEKMEENINNTANSSNKDRYIKAIDCFKQGCDTILSGNECVSYSVFVNEGGATTTAVDAPAVAPAVAPAADEGEEKTSAIVQASAAVEGEEDTSAVVPASAVEGKEETSAVAEPTVTEGDDDNVQAPAEVSVAEEDTRGAADDAEAKAAAATTEGEEKKKEEDTLPATPQATQPAATTTASATTTATASDSDSEQDGGRPRRRSRPSQRIKSRKSKKGRMTRRKHRAARR